MNPLANEKRIVNPLRNGFHLLESLSLTHKKKREAFALSLFLGSGLDRLDTGDEAAGVALEGIQHVPLDPRETVATGHVFEGVVGRSGDHFLDLVGMDSVVEEEGEELEALLGFLRELGEIPSPVDVAVPVVRLQVLVALGSLGSGFLSLGSGLVAGRDEDDLGRGDFDLEALSGGDGGDGGEEIGREHSTAF